MSGEASSETIGSGSANIGGGSMGGVSGAPFRYVYSVPNERKTVVMPFHQGLWPAIQLPISAAHNGGVESG